MTLKEAYAKVKKMDEVLDSDILNDEEYTSVAKRRFKLMEKIGLEEHRQKQLSAYSPNNLSDWGRGFLDSFLLDGKNCHHLTIKQKCILHNINGYEPFRYSDHIFKYVKDCLLTEKINKKSFLEEI